MIERPAFTIGIEEEYLVVDVESRELVQDLPDGLMAACEEILGGKVSPEFLRSQIEVGTKVCNSIAEAKQELRALRRCIRDVVESHGLAMIAASTHPFSNWRDQKQTEKDRYQALTLEMQGTARRLLICGMHVHVGIDDNELRIDLMNQMSYFLPHLLALSCSSPFWRGFDTGLRSYRLTVFDALPRTGLPERFASWAEYERHIKIMENAGLIADSSRIWWDMRPSVRFPTLETRVMDVCTRLDDTVCLTALTACIMRMLYRLRCENQRWRLYAPMLLMENRWRAMRYSFDEGLIDLAKGEVVPHSQLVEELLEIVRKDAEELGCLADVERAMAFAEKRLLSRPGPREEVSTKAHRRDWLLQRLDRPLRRRLPAPTDRW